MKHLITIAIILLLSLSVFLTITSIYFEKVEGTAGEGYSLGFTFTWGIIISIFLVLLSLFQYAISKTNHISKKH